MFFAIINNQFKTSELKTVEKLVKQTVQALKPYYNRLGMWGFLYNLWNYIPSGPWKVLKNGCNFLYEPWLRAIACFVMIFPNIAMFWSFTKKKICLKKGPSLTENVYFSNIIIVTHVT